MSNENTAPEIYVIVPGETRDFSFSFAGKLDPSETLTGTPTVTSDNPLTIAAVRVNEAAILIAGLFVPALQSVLCTAAGAVDGTAYVLTVQAGTSSGQTLIGYARLVGGTT